ncbi:hypothetical protein SDC49_21945 [Lactobacillus sp. R2/2]|nr:hypothetical protein [Lactobacillus sp. R2/2]
MISLYPNANFVGYNPLATDRPIVKNVLLAAQDTAAQEIQAELDKITHAGFNLTDAEKGELDKAITIGNAAIAKGPNNNGTSVYDSDVNDIKTVNERKDKALGALKEAYKKQKLFQMLLMLLRILKQ